MKVNYINLFQAFFLLIVGYALAKGAGALAEKLLIRLTITKYKKLAQQIAFYTVFILFLFSTLDQLGFDLQVILGAAGIFSIAIGFASQTSASNFISGLFLIFEKVIFEGDTITVDGITGEVISVDLLSTKLKTADNLFVRIPNEMLIKSKLANLSRFPHRRLDLTIMLPYEQNLSDVKSLWLAIVESHPLCLKVPSPEFTVQSIPQDYISLLLSVWVEERHYSQLKNELQQQLLNSIVKNKLKLYVAYPHAVDMK